MLQITPDKVAHVIIRAREMEADFGGFADAEGYGSAAAADLRAFIANLNDDEQASLVAVMWVGRETFDAEEIAEAIATAKAEATAPTEDYLMGMPMLADYLEDGLNALGVSLEDAEEGVLRST
ncbi:MAG: DUF3775 domain-containing protein [Rhodobacteraceae bacterium]|nr:DUF3775 domain-containing protein [Paracoccaceae bacterium]